jgi:hypothetical protein
MLDPRIYRAGLILAALALVVLAFSLQDQPGALGSTLAPEAFNGQNVVSAMKRIARTDPSRRPGSDGDQSLAAEVATDFAGDQFAVSSNISTDTFTGHTVDGTRTLENVVAVRPGLESGTIVVVAHRDALGAPARASLSGTATLLELSRDLAGETLHRTIVLASTSGSQGTAGAIQLASTLGGPIDAVIVLGDLGSAQVHQPIVVPWSTGTSVASPQLRNTLGAAIGAQSSLGVGATGVAGQFAHLAFPFTLSEQAPFGARGVPAVLLSLSGDQGPAAEAPLAPTAQLTELGRAVLQTISALDSGPAIAPASPYLLFDGKVVPGWAMSLFVLTLLIPVVLTMVDGLARARRRGHVIWRSLVLVLAAAVPFALGVLVVLAAGLLGVIAAAPPGPVAPGAVPLKGAGIAVLVIAACVVLGSLVGVWALASRLRPPGPDPTGRGRDRSNDGAVAALLVVLCAVTLVIWLANPFAAALLVPAVHLWLWAVNPDLRLPVPARLVLVVIGLAPVVLVVFYYADTLGFSPLQAAWGAALLIAGHGISLLAVGEWSVVLGCLVSVTTIALLAARGSRVEPAPITVRGPITYAGPGSLGGTKSALRR